MRVGAIADLHGYLPDIPKDLDMLLVAGDIGFFKGEVLESFKGWASPIEEFRNWILEAHCPVIGIGGNHDFVFQDYPDVAKNLPWRYLEDEAAEIEGFKLYGSPWCPFLKNWAFYGTDSFLEEAWAKIPNDTEILITHCPPYGILDTLFDGKSVGSKSLRDRVKELPNLMLHVFGHIHSAQGVGHLAMHDTIFANVSYCGGEAVYDPVGSVVEFEL